MPAPSNQPTKSRWFYSNIYAKIVKALGSDTGILCVRRAYGFRNGGNQWSGWVAYLSFFRHIVKLPMDYSKWAHYETAAELAGPRYMHSKFCIISERPTVLLVDEDNRPHCETGPFCEWADGTKLWAWHGVRVPGWVIEHPENITIEDVANETNEEARRVLIERMTPARYLAESKAKIIDMDHEVTETGSAPRVLLEDSRGQRWFVGTDGSTSRSYYMPVTPGIKTCRAAHEERCGFNETLIKNKS